MVEGFSYPDSFARFYDVMYAQLRTMDRDFFVRKILETKGPVLEIGVGTGRVFMGAFDAGADIYGIDISSSMLEQLKAKLDPKHHQRIYRQDVRSLRLNRTFDLILAPARVFSHLVEIDDQIRALDSVYNHLNPGGRFIFDVFVPNLEILLHGMNEQLDFDGEYAPGKRINRVVSSKPDLVNQISHVTMTLTWDEDGGVKSETWETPFRFFFRYELEHLVGRSKLELTNIYGDYEEHELGPQSTDFVLVCERTRLQQ
jgi:ubiquinone/menaquinone biosynthesis C-methylase UbiE